jgi:phage tail sheath gpL-like
VDSAKDAFGQGGPGHLMAKILYAKYPGALIDFCAPTAGAGSATLDTTATGTPTGNNVVDFDIMGRTLEVEWLAAVTAADFATLAIARINELADDLMVTASSGGAGVITLTSKVTGNIGNDVLVKAKLRLAQTGTEAIDNNTHTNLASGSADPDFATALSSIAGREYHFILPALSNTDVEQITTDNGLQDVLTHIGNYNSGLGAKLQQVIVGHTGAIADAVATAADANGGNDDYNAEIVCCVNGRSLPCEFAAREAAGRLAAESLDPAANRIGELFDLVVGSHDVTADRPSAAECETALDGGVSIITYTEYSEAEQLVRAVTCRGSDKRCTDVQNVSATYIVSRDIRDNLPLAFPNAKITPDVEEGDDPPPAGVIEERDIKAWNINRLRAWQNEGVIQKASLDQAIANGSLVVQVNESDPTQVDMVLPFKIVQPLAKFGVVPQRIPG